MAQHVYARAVDTILGPHHRQQAVEVRRAGAKEGGRHGDHNRVRCPRGGRDGALAVGIDEHVLVATCTVQARSPAALAPAMRPPPAAPRDGWESARRWRRETHAMHRRHWPTYGSRPRSSASTSRARSRASCTGSLRNSALRSGEGTSTSSSARARADTTAWASVPAVSILARRARNASRAADAGRPFTVRGNDGDATATGLPVSALVAESIAGNGSGELPAEEAQRRAIELPVDRATRGVGERAPSRTPCPSAVGGAEIGTRDNGLAPVTRRWPIAPTGKADGPRHRPITSTITHHAFGFVGPLRATRMGTLRPGTARRSTVSLAGIVAERQHPRPVAHVRDLPAPRPPARHRSKCR